jgi:hypothetical protein
MSSNRLAYDTTAYASNVKRSTDPLEYAMNPAYSKNCAVCQPEPGIAYPENVAPLTEPRVELENNLSSRTWRKDRRQPGGMSDDEFNQLSIKYGNQGNMRSCEAQEVRHSLLTNPKSTYRSLTTEHLIFHALPINPQTYVPIIGNPGLNSRQIAIDSYRKIMDANGSCDRSASNCSPRELPTWP